MALDLNKGASSIPPVGGRLAPPPGGYGRELERVDRRMAADLRQMCASSARSIAEFEQMYEYHAERVLCGPSSLAPPFWQYPIGTPPMSQMIGAPMAPAKPPLDLAVLEKLKAVEPRKIGEKVPDRVEPITAWRAWKVYNDAGIWKLKAVGMTGVWEPRKAMEAICGASKEKHPAPGYGCECGLWSFTTLDDLVPALENYTDLKVIGKVAIWGRVIECEHGFRSSHAYPTELWLLDNQDNLEQLGYTYGVPVRKIEKEEK